MPSPEYRPFRFDEGDDLPPGAPPLRMGGRFEVDRWREKERFEKGVDREGLPESSPDDPPTANESGNGSVMRR